MKRFSKVNSRVVGYTLAVLFVLTMIFSTVYSRAFAVRQMPWVSLTLPEHRTIYMTFEITGVAQPAYTWGDVEDFDWVAIGTLYEADYIDGMGVPPPVWVGFQVSVNTAYAYFFSLPGEILGISGMRGDIEYVVGFVSSDSPLNIGDEVLIRAELQHLRDQPTIPISSVHFDVFENRHYIYVVIRRDGAWGREFVVQRKNVEIIEWLGRQNMSYVTSSVITDPIVMWSDRQIYDGALVRLFD